MMKTEAKHTPGPWHVCCDKCLTIRAKGADVAKPTKGEYGDSYPVIMPQEGTTTLEGKYEVVMEMMPMGNMPFEEAKANAHLLAAAPALYEALMDMVETHENLEGCTDCTDMVKARAALDAATGVPSND